MLKIKVNTKKIFVCVTFKLNLMENLVMIIKQSVFHQQAQSDYCLTFTRRDTCLFSSKTQMFLFSILTECLFFFLRPCL